MDSFKGRLKGLDAFTKTMDDARFKTTSGGVVSLVSVAAMTILFISEFLSFLRVDRQYTLSVDSTREESLRIFLDVDLSVQCEYLGINADDTTGTRKIEIKNNIFKTRILPDGRRTNEQEKLRQKVVLPPDYCGSCYGAAPDGTCCNTCDDVRHAYGEKRWSFNDGSGFEQCEREGTLGQRAFREGEGCNIRGHVDVGRVRGRLQILIGHSFDMGGVTLHDVSVLRNSKVDLSHNIRMLSFGERYPSQESPLDGVSQSGSANDNKLGVYEYFCKVVPTTYRTRWGRTIITNQYSVTEYFMPSDPTSGGTRAPGLDFEYDFSPIRVDYIETRGSIFHFITQTCAIVGGIFTVSGLIDSGVYSATKRLRKNDGKLS